jgi:hypothetical protein
MLKSMDVGASLLATTAYREQARSYRECAFSLLTDYQDALIAPRTNINPAANVASEA